MTGTEKDIVWMIWRNEQGESFKVGELNKRAGKFYFKYDIEGVKKAEPYGFSPLPYLPRIDAEYFREELFRSFLQRLPQDGKKDTNNILKEYNIEQYDAFELLKKTGGKVSTDTFEFTTPFEENVNLED